MRSESDMMSLHTFRINAMFQFYKIKKKIWLT